MKDTRKALFARVSADTHQAARQAALDQGISTSQLVEEAVKKYLKEEEEKMTNIENIKENYRYMKVEELRDALDALETWDAVDADIYAYLCDELGLDYKSYDDPDKMWNDINEKLEK